MRAIFLGFSLLVACSGGGSGDGDGGVGDGGLAAVPGDEGTYLSVTLRKDPGGITLLDAQSILRTTAPRLTTTGDLLVVAWQGGAVQDAGFVTFPTTLRAEGPEAGEAIEVVIDLGGESTATLDLFAPSGIEQLTVHDAAGALIATLDVPTNPGALTEAEAWVPLASAPWLSVLRPSAALSLLPEAALQLIQTVIDPITELTDAQRTRLQRALQLVPPDVLDASRFVVISTFKPRAAGLLGFATGTTLVIRADLLDTAEPTLEFTTIHELTHVFDGFMGFNANPQNLEGFLVGLDPDAAQAARARVQERVRHRRFDRALGVIFDELMAVARGLGMTEETYCGALDPKECWINLNERAYAAGAAIPYGVATLAEDVASWVHTTEALEVTRIPRAHLCSELASAQTLQTRGHLLAYAKLAVLKGVGAITDAAFDACVGAFPIPRSDRPGIFLHKTGTDEVFELPMAVQAGWTKVLGYPMFSVIAGSSDGQYQGLVQVLAPGDRKFPTRLSSLSDINAVTVDLPLSGFFLSHSTELGRARASRSGLVLFTELSTDRVEGIILFLELQSDLFVVTDTFEVGTFLWTP